MGLTTVDLRVAARASKSVALLAEMKVARRVEYLVELWAECLAEMMAMLKVASMEKNWVRQKAAE